MKELAELAFTYGGWWIWFGVYERRFSITHLPEDGVCSVRIDVVGIKDSVAVVSTVMELAEYIRKYCPKASENGNEILIEVKAAMRASIKK